ncbi:unnamed protein product [Tilletia controversa]|nr:unnamed protein product [Tilletia controversa]
MNISPLVSLLFLPSVLAHSSRAISTPASLSLGHMLSVIFLTSEAGHAMEQDKLDTLSLEGGHAVWQALAQRNIDIYASISIGKKSKLVSFAVQGPLTDFFVKPFTRIQSAPTSTTLHPLRWSSRLRANQLHVPRCIQDPYVSRVMLWHWVYHGASTKDDKPIAASLIDRIRGEEVAKLTKLSSKRLDLSKRYLSQQVRVKAPSECVDASSTAAQERGYGLGWPVARCACMKGYIGARAVAGWMALKRRTALRSSGSDICRAALSSAPNRPD